MGTLFWPLNKKQLNWCEPSVTRDPPPLHVRYELPRPVSGIRKTAVFMVLASFQEHAQDIFTSMQIPLSLWPVSIPKTATQGSGLISGQCQGNSLHFTAMFPCYFSRHVDLNDMQQMNRKISGCQGVAR